MVAYIIKSDLLLMLFYAYFLLFMRKSAIFRFNRAALMLGTVACMLLPLVNFSMELLPEIATLPHLVIPETTISGTATGTADAPFNLVRLFAGIYLAGAATVFFLISVSLARTVSVLRRSRAVKTPEGWISVVDSDIPSFSFLRHIVISHEDYVNNPVILKHELAHVRFHHSADLLSFSAVLVLHWFNPLVWIIRSELKMLHEYEADEAVIKQGIDAKQYQLLLVKKAVGAQRFQLANGFNHTKLKNRITMMQTTKTNKWAGLGYIFCLPMLFAALCFCTNRNDIKADDASLTISEIESNADEVQSIPFTMVDVRPQFEGGDASAFSKWVSERLIYPESAKEAGIEGKVFLSFTVDTKGKVTNVNVVKSVDEALSNEAVRVVCQSPDWTPGKMDGKKVSVTYTFPIVFNLK